MALRWFLTLSQHFAKFGVHGSSAGGDIMYSICPVTSYEHLIEGQVNLYVRASRGMVVP